VKSVLIIDDNQDFADSLALLLRLNGHDTSVAYEPTAGVRVAQRTCPDIIVLDIGLPAISGYEVARKLRRNSAFEKTVLVAVTGLATDEHRQRAYASGFDLHCTKPLDTGDLRTILQYARADSSKPVTRRD